MSETQTVTVERLFELEEAEKRLSALERAGVDNWSGYDYAMKILRGEVE